MTLNLIFFGRFQIGLQIYVAHKIIHKTYTNGKLHLNLLSEMFHYYI